MNFYLVRHGDKIKTAGDPGLSTVGRKQAQLTANYFLNKDISTIVSSPFARTEETAELISKTISVSYTIDNRLKERLNWGDDPNLSFEEFLLEWEKTDKNRDYEPRVGMSSTQAGKRLLEVLKEFKNHKYENVVLISHGGIIIDLLRNIFGDEYLASKRSGFVDGGISECSITTISTKNGAYKLEEFASIDHLYYVK
jgi:broad specificity phosphatase PhoE